MERFKIVGHVSSGAHGVILKAIYRCSVHNSQTREAKMLAIKRIFVRGDSLPLSIVREIKCLELLDKEPHIVSLLEVFTHGNTVNLVFPLLPTNLTSLIYNYTLTNEQKITYSFMLVKGVQSIHSHGLIHRDLKPANLLISWKGILKICDFGQARICESGVPMSHQVSTRWYRSPELLYGSDRYGQEVDMWSVGCVIGEIFTRTPLFLSDSDIGQLFCVISHLGIPPTEWASQFPDFNKISFNLNDDELKRKQSEWKNMLNEAVPNQEILQIILDLCSYRNRPTVTQLLSRTPFDVLNKDGIHDHDLVVPSTTEHLVGPPKEEESVENE